jgi:hypothetical protein
MGPDGYLWVLHNDSPGARGGDEIGRYVYVGEPNPGIQALPVSNQVIGGSVTCGLRANFYDIVLAWVSFSVLPSPAPTPYGPMLVPLDLVVSFALVFGDDHAYIPVSVPNNPVFTGLTLYAQGASISPAGLITTTSNFGSTVMW